MLALMLSVGAPFSRDVALVITVIGTHNAPGNALLSVREGTGPGAGPSGRLFTACTPPAPPCGHGPWPDRSNARANPAPPGPGAAHVLPPARTTHPRSPRRRAAGWGAWPCPTWPNHPVRTGRGQAPWRCRDAGPPPDGRAWAPAHGPCRAPGPGPRKAPACGAGWPPGWV